MHQGRGDSNGGGAGRGSAATGASGTTNMAGMDGTSALTDD